MVQGYNDIEFVTLNFDFCRSLPWATEDLMRLRKMRWLSKVHIKLAYALSSDVDHFAMNGLECHSLLHAFRLHEVGPILGAEARSKSSTSLSVVVCRDDLHERGSWRLWVATTLLALLLTTFRLNQSYITYLKIFKVDHRGKTQKRINRASAIYPPSKQLDMTAPTFFRYSTGIQESKDAPGFAWEHPVPVNEFWNSFNYTTAANFLTCFSQEEVDTMNLEKHAALSNTEKATILVTILKDKIMSRETPESPLWKTDNKTWQAYMRAISTTYQELGLVDERIEIEEQLIQKQVDKSNPSYAHTLAW